MNNSSWIKRNLILSAGLVSIFSLYACSRAEHSPDTERQQNARDTISNFSRDTSITEANNDSVADNPPAVKKSVEWKNFHGPAFDVQYPSSFTVTSSGETEGMLFVAPDRSVQFYVFSPLWNGESTQRNIDPTSEIVKQQSIEREGSRRITRVTYQRQDDLHLRSFEDVEDTLHNTRRIFGVYYTDQKAYAEYKELYLLFKKSLKQYSD